MKNFYITLITLIVSFINSANAQTFTPDTKGELLDF